jgi:hypothetical protein
MHARRCALKCSARQPPGRSAGGHTSRGCCRPPVCIHAQCSCNCNCTLHAQGGCNCDCSIHAQGGCSCKHSYNCTIHAQSVAVAGLLLRPSRVRFVHQGIRAWRCHDTCCPSGHQGIALPRHVLSWRRWLPAKADQVNMKPWIHISGAAGLGRARGPRVWDACEGKSKDSSSMGKGTSTREGR